MSPCASRPEGHGLNADTVLVVSPDNINPGATTSRDRQLAPTVADPLHYDSFMHAEEFIRVSSERPATYLPAAIRLCLPGG